jgi:carbon storage regulator CsrA
MLVLSRRVDEELVFPSLDIRIKILKNLTNRVQLGIKAPDFIEVARGERVDLGDPDLPSNQPSRHQMLNHLNALRLGLELYERQMARGDIAACNHTFLQVVGRLRRADQGCSEAANDNKANSPRVLVVDDDANERQLLAGLLELDGCVVETANDGFDAVSFLQHGAMPDVVLLDMQMPRLAGKDTLAAIRQGWQKLLVFGVSASTPAENEIALGGPHGIDEWFEKPLNPSQLVRRMRERLGRSLMVSA